MDDTEYVCPLCCEELDISDREFYPCKCGYQVCMWCWHRIRESESGLCPACRTPYGEDPHQFSAVDVEEVLKANKEKEAAAKREKRHHPLGGGGGTGGMGDSALSSGGVGGFSDGGDGPSSRTGAIDVPKDRTSLANMRVIRRNLVYAVGLPPSIASEDTLRKPEYFGQYGRISKIVLNRSQTTAADPRRASASAYVTFVHKEDTLACILALDGFYLENRNIRASYGTSKYCSAFIKSVRCNNPDCTYLHEMGAPEDTFTKQEIQAGYVTSGRDVLARQQEIVAEQLRQGSSSGGTAPPRKRVGGGGPSGTGRGCANPVFPAPEFDEPAKSSPPTAFVPPPGRATRSLSAAAAVAAAPSAAAVAAGSKMPRSSSVSAGRSPPLGPLSVSASDSLPRLAVPSAATAKRASSVGATAASVVAGVHAVAPRADPPEPHTTLTPLTPLKRPGKGNRSAPNAATAVQGEEDKLVSLRNGSAKKSNGVRLSSAQTSHATGAGAASTAASTATATATAASSGAPSVEQQCSRRGVPSIGGDVIGPPPKSLTSNDPVAGAGVDSLGGRPIGLDGLGVTRSSALGGEVFTGQLPHTSKTAIGSGKDKWNSGGTPVGGAPVGGTPLSTGPMLVTNVGASAGLWGGGGHSHPPPQKGLISGGAAAPLVGSSGIIGSHISPGAAETANSSSALASILGINLPTGSGSLRESSNLWSNPVAPQEHSRLSALNAKAIPSQGVIGGTSMNTSAGSGSSLIGGVPIGGGASSSSALLNPPGTIGGSGKSDIALLQSLLPGVHITSGNEFGGSPGWGGGAAPGHHHHQQPLGPSSLNGESLGGATSTWGGAGMGSAAPGSSSVGAIGQNVATQNQRQQGPGIW